MEWNGQGRGGAGEEMEKLEVPAKATELLFSLAWLIPGELPLSPTFAWVVFSVGTAEREGLTPGAPCRRDLQLERVLTTG